LPSPRLALERFGFALLVAALILGAVNAVLRFPDQFDFITYHLPSALQRFGLTTYTAYPWLQNIINGHPPVAHWVIAALVGPTGEVSAATLLGSLAFAGFVVGFRYLSGDTRQTGWLMVAALSVPLVAIHLYAPYVDLWMGAWLALALFAAVRAVNHGLTHREALVFCIGAGLAAGTKFQAWPGLGILWIWAALHWWHAAFRRRTTSRRLVLITLAASAALLAFWPARNWVRFDNPTHPWKTPVIGRYINNPATTIPLIGASERVIPDVLVTVPQPLRFSYSVFEVGRLWTGTVTYTHDMWNDGNASDNHNHRSGGWGLWTMLLLLVWWVHWLRRGDPAAKRTLVLFLALAGVISCLSRSPEIRYWMFLPLGSFACLVHYDLRFVTAAPRAWIGTGAVLLCFTLTLHSAWRPLRYPGQASLLAAAPPGAQAFWKIARPGVPYQSPPHDYAIFWAGEDFNRFIIRPGGLPLPAPAAAPASEN
jgi:hypothetical protein